MTDPGAMPRPRTRPTIPLIGRADHHSFAVGKFLGVALAAMALLFAAAIPAAAAELMRVTFVRHGQSAGNASGLIDTSTPGPVLTELGQQQARAVVGTLGDNNYDAIYASTMVRTQLTAAPLSQYLGLPIQVLPGLQEIEAGAFEGTPESQASQGYGLIPVAWALQGNRDVAMPGTNPTLNGHTFDGRVDGALQTMYDNGDRNAVVFSHGGTIMFWTMMNANNLTVADKLKLLQTAPLDNTDYVVLEGNPEDGWTLVNWNGQQFSTEPTLAAEVKLQFRTLTRQLSATVRGVTASLDSRDLPTIATALNRGIAEATHSVVKFQRAVTAKVIRELDTAVPKQSGAEPAPAATHPVQATADDLKSAPTEPAAPKTAEVTPRKERLTALKSVTEPAEEKLAGAKSASARPTGDKPSDRLRDAVADVHQVTKSIEKSIQKAVEKLSAKVQKRATDTSGTDSDNGGQRDAA